MTTFTEQITSDQKELWRVIELLWNADINYRRMAVRLDLMEEELADEIDRMREAGHELDMARRSAASNEYLLKIRPPTPPVPETAWERSFAYWKDKTAGFVYFIRSGDTGEVKIGMARNPRTRLRELQTASPRKLRILHALPGYAHAEAHFHRQHSSSRLECGEWFEGPEVEATIARLDTESDEMIARHRETGEFPAFAKPPGPQFMDPAEMRKDKAARPSPRQDTTVGSAPEHDRPWGRKPPKWLEDAPQKFTP